MMASADENVGAFLYRECISRVYTQSVCVEAGIDLLNFDSQQVYCGTIIKVFF